MPFDGTQLNETAAHLLRAKRYIEEHGWKQGTVGHDGGPRCGFGALVSTMVGARWSIRSAGFLNKAAPDRVFPRWQDAPNRTVEEVYAAFDRAIALALEPQDKK